MEIKTLLIVIILTLLNRDRATGYMFDFYLLEEKHSVTEHAVLCEDRGYDGLAVLSSPEAFAYAVKLIAHVGKAGVYIGFGTRYKPVTGALLWDDGTAARSDTPFFRKSFPGTDSSRPFGHLVVAGDIRMTNGVAEKYGLCGNYENAPSESHGRTVSGELQTSGKITLSVSELFSFPECALVCGMTIECRAAEFNSDLMTCTLIGEYTMTGVVLNPQVVTYLRNPFARPSPPR